jgi:hypothetical protein
VLERGVSGFEMSKQIWAGRYEVALETSLEPTPPGGWRQAPDGKFVRPQEPVKIWFQSRRFTWHPGTETILPVITVMIPDADDYSAERLATNRFLSAVAYETGMPIREVTSSASGFKKEDDPPLLQQPRAGVVGTRVGPEIVVDDDPDLLKCLALCREGQTAGSDALAFLSYWKAVEVAVGERGFRAWMMENSAVLGPRWSREQSEPERTPEGWFEHLRQSRVAAAHAVPREPGHLRIDPDDPDLFPRLAIDANRMRILARRAIEGRWPKPVRSIDPPADMLGRGAEWERMLRELRNAGE